MTIHTITTTDGTTFTPEDSAAMARLIYKRFGHDPDAATDAWRRMLGNSCPVSDFMAMIQAVPAPVDAPSSVVIQKAALDELWTAIDSRDHGYIVEVARLIDKDANDFGPLTPHEVNTIRILRKLAAMGEGSRVEVKR